MSSQKIQQNVYFEEDQIQEIKRLQIKLKNEGKDRSISQLIRELTIQSLKNDCYGN